MPELQSRMYCEQEDIAYEFRYKIDLLGKQLRYWRRSRCKAVNLLLQLWELKNEKEVQS